MAGKHFAIYVLTPPATTIYASRRKRETLDFSLGGAGRLHGWLVAGTWRAS